ncbi:hypothetical protein FQA39_LY14862 [Lamprigera yunnana]|nr:hypothetical protein FQA39_LY14862 [Lamprigera yunnana]
MNTDLDKINAELVAFYEYCKKNRISDQDILKICHQLTTTVQKVKLKRNMLLVFTLIAFMVTTYCALKVEAISWHASAIGRIILIKLLPIWNWQYLKNEKCFLDKFTKVTDLEFNCALCESYSGVYVEENPNSVYIKERYLDLHQPLIVIDSLQGWPTVPLLNFSEDIFLKSTPCRLSTNTYSGFATVGKILNRVIDFDQYFLHFQNCDSKAAKAFRLYAPKPSFVPEDMSPIQYKLMEPVTVIGQVQGSNYIRLTPRLNCRYECLEFNLELSEGEAILFTSMWELEYKPNPLQENVAIILEMH